LTEAPKYADGAPAILLAMTFVTGIVDAVSFLGLGHVFTANMTGNIAFLGFALAGAPNVSIPRSLLALICFSAGAVIGGKMTSRMWVIRAFAVEAFLVWAAAAVSIGSKEPFKIQGVIALTAVAMGLRNAVVRKLGVPDLTTTVLTMTITAFAADSTLAGGDNVRWQRRLAAVVAMLGGAAAGAFLLGYSIALALGVCGVITSVCAFLWFHIESKRGHP
jgi:uncharacterized membrane protein YoaK (UPF0700 family)